MCLDADSWGGATLMWATGPKSHVIGMNIKSKTLGLLINSKGMWTRENPLVRFQLRPKKMSEES